MDSPLFIAIAAMSLNRVIGAGNYIPWYLPEDFKWFKSVTTGHVLIMGRKTFESIGRPLPNRTTIVLSRSGFTAPNVVTLPGLEALDPEAPAFAGRKLFLCGGAQVYQQTLSLWSELLLTVVKRQVEGDAFFPAFENQLHLAETIRTGPEFDILRFVR